MFSVIPWLLISVIGRGMEETLGECIIGWD